jgi:uncharacterized membrane protein
MARESRLRSILKAISWRFIATSTTFMLAYFIFSSAECEDVLEKSSIVAGLEVILKLIIYYLHERAWQMAPRGSIRKIFSPKK